MREWCGVDGKGEDRGRRRRRRITSGAFDSRTHLQSDNRYGTFTFINTYYMIKRIWNLLAHCDFVKLLHIQWMIRLDAFFQGTTFVLVCILPLYSLIEVNSETTSIQRS
ncbi:hypothetical protein L1987_22029 [Smallanthus sonchifolius]|uniref:Uncharacterized protein n=1 Tax=Smallanthus sonchifolius TaxID=185202 RepID=A0ACB9IEC3_9ASTR|nr:hypothetical protein L1987_22029 [Smallanthus sonchifolius]